MQQALCFGPRDGRAAPFVLLSDLTVWWNLVEDDLVQVNVHGSRRWLLVDDVDALEASDPAAVEGVRLLPPGDLFLQVADREVLVADRDRQKRLWRTLHAPGAVLVDGSVVGMWRGRKKSRRLEVTVEPFEVLASRVADTIVDEAQTVAHVRGLHEASVDITATSDST